MTLPSPPTQILLVEDSPSDIELTREALSEGRIANVLHVVTDGEQALAFLRKEGDFADAPRPGLVLLDLQLPRKSGLEVLRELREDPELTDLVVVVLTTSTGDRDILESYRLHANSYVGKPLELDEFLSAVRGIEGYWLSIVRLPRGAAQ